MLELITLALRALQLLFAIILLGLNGWRTSQLPSLRRPHH